LINNREQSEGENLERKAQEQQYLDEKYQELRNILS